MTTQWSIAQLERTTATGGVTIAHWRATATDGEYSASHHTAHALLHLMQTQKAL
jgi:predicted fused transcriptional regulator/phosphomethylpyrimidine kinase